MKHVASFDLDTLTWTRLPDMPEEVHARGFIHDGSNLVLPDLRGGDFAIFDEANSSFHMEEGYGQRLLMFQVWGKEGSS
jgi:hypothetical protein